MKKLFSILICLSLLWSFCVPSYAASKTYALDANGLSMTIDVPDHYVVKTDNLGVAEERVKEFGEYGERIMQSDSAGIVLSAWDKTAQDEIAVTCVDSPLDDYNQLGDTSLMALASAVGSALKEVGGEVSAATIFQGAQAKFIRYVMTLQHQGASGAYEHIIQYSTAYGGQAVNITLHSYDGEPTDLAAAELEEIVLSSRFGANPVPAPEAEQTPSFVYTDEERGVSFTVPADWKVEALNKEREVLKAKFASTQEQGLSILYGWMDFYPLFEELGMSEEYPRESVNQDFFTVQDMNAFLGAASEYAENETEVSSVTDVNYGGNDFFKATQKGSATVYGLTMSASMVTLYHFDHGYLYQFQFPGSEDSPYFEDFIQLVSSVKFTSC